MDRKKILLPLLVSSAMIGMWACGEGEIIYADDNDEMVRSKTDPKSKNALSDDELFQVFVKYCKSKKGKKEGCDADKLIKSSSSQADEGSSTSKKKSSSSNVNPNSAGDANSGTSTTSSSSGVPNSNDSSKSSSSSNPHSGNSSSSAKGLGVSGKCELIKPSVVHVGDAVIWRYLPDENSLESANFVWDVVAEVETGLVDGALSGSGLPEITVSFKKPGKKYGPTLTFGGKDFDCENIQVYEEGVDPGNSSAFIEDESSSSGATSSASQPKSSASSVPEGHCAVSKSKVRIGDVVEWYIADPEGNVLSAFHNWLDIGAGGELVGGEQRGNGSTKISVKYSSPGAKILVVQFAKQGMLSCDKDDEGFDLLFVEDAEESSSSTIPEESSSSEGNVSSASKPNPNSSSSFDVIDM